MSSTLLCRPEFEEDRTKTRQHEVGKDYFRVHQWVWRRTRKRSVAEIGTVKQVLSVLFREKCIHVRRTIIVPR